MLRTLWIAAALLSLHAQVGAAGTDLDKGIDALKGGRYAEALALIQPLAQAGDAQAERVIGEMHYRGQGVPVNKITAFKWSRAAADQEDMIAQYSVGYMFETGDGTAASAKMALDYYKKSALQHYIPAQLKLGELLRDSDPDAAIYWYSAAMKSGDEEGRRKFSALSSRTVNERESASRATELDRRAQVEEACTRMCTEGTQRDRCLAGLFEASACTVESQSQVAVAAPAASAGDIIRAEGARALAGYAQIQKAQRQSVLNPGAREAERQRTEQQRRDAEQAHEHDAAAHRGESERKQQAPARAIEAPQQEPLPQDRPPSDERMATAQQLPSQRTPEPVGGVAGGNSGRRAMECVQATKEGDDVAFRNTCGKPIFIVWCGEQKYSRKRCGDGPAGNSFYTHSDNVKPGDKSYARGLGEYKFAACEGGISFGKNEIVDRPDGSFTCVAGKNR